MNIPDDLKYTENDEWVRVEGDTATIGITDYAQEQLNDLVYVELKDVGETIAAGETVGEVESVKAASDVYSPVAGEIIEINEELEDDPEIVNTDPYGKGWMVKLKVTDDAGLSGLMDAAAYKARIENL